MYVSGPLLLTFEVHLASKVGFRKSRNLPKSFNFPHHWVFMSFHAIQRRLWHVHGLYEIRAHCQGTNPDDDTDGTSSCHQVRWCLSVTWSCTFSRVRAYHVRTLLWNQRPHDSRIFPKTTGTLSTPTPPLIVSAVSGQSSSTSRRIVPYQDLYLQYVPT